MIGGAVLNSPAFIGSNYLAKYLAGDNGQAALERKHGMTKRWKLIRRRWLNTRASARSSLTGLKPTEKSKLRRSTTSRTPITRSSSTIRSTMTRDQLCAKCRSSRTFISQVSSRNRASFLLVVVAHSHLDTQLFVSFELFCCIKISGYQARQNLLQPSSSGLLE